MPANPPVAFGDRLRAVRERIGVTQQGAADALGVSQPTYSRIEDGSRPLKGSELVTLADAFGVRAAAITDVGAIANRAQSMARTDGSTSEMLVMTSHLCAYLELDGYLTQAGIPAR